MSGLYPDKVGKFTEMMILIAAAQQAEDEKEPATPGEAEDDRL